MRVDYYLNGFPVNPVKRQDIYLEVNHDQEAVIDRALPHVGINNLYFAREDVSYIMSQLSQPPGITEGIPFEIRITERGQTQVIQMYLDLMHGLERSNDGITASVKMLQSLDWMDDKVDAFTFESMYNETGVTPFIIDGVSYSSYKHFFDTKCIYVPYVISSIPNWHDVALMLFGIVFTGTQLYQIAMDITTSFAAVAADPFMYGELIKLVALIAYAALLLTTLSSLLTQMLNCLVQPLKYHGAMLMSDMLKVTAAKLGLAVQSSIWNSYPYNQIAYIPEKYSPLRSLTPSVLNILGFDVDGIADTGYTAPTLGDQKGYFNGTGGDFLRLIKRFCNGKVIIPNASNQLVLERRDYYPANNLYQLPDLRSDWNTYNTNELQSTTILKFLSDLNEKNSIEHRSQGGVPFFPGTIMQITHRQIQTTNSKLVCLKGLREITITAARGVAKDSLTVIESSLGTVSLLYAFIYGATQVVTTAATILIDVLLVVINVVIAIWNIMVVILRTITTIINSIIDFINTLGAGLSHIPDFLHNSSLGLIPLINPLNPFFGAPAWERPDISTRYDALLVENDILSTPKIVMVDISRSEFIGNRIAYLHRDNASIVNCQHLWDKFYSIDAFVDVANTANRMNRYTKISPALNRSSDKNRCILSLADFQNLVDYPQFKDGFSEPVIADSIQWFIEQGGAAEFQYRKSGWLKSPQHPNAVNRSEEININLTLKTSLPNGQ
jgi:hypothetical protein